MLKVVSASYLQGRLRHLSTKFSPRPLNVKEPKTRLMTLFDSLKSNDCSYMSFLQKARFCSESDQPKKEVEESDQSNATNEVEVVTDAANSTEACAEAEAKTESAIIPTNPRPDDHLQVIALPLSQRPLFPGFYMPISVKDSKLQAALLENHKRSIVYAGAFLLKDDPGSDSKFLSGSEENNSSEVKGKELFNRLHNIGTLAKITSIQGKDVVLWGYRRLRITEMVNEDPLTVRVEHLKDNTYNKEDDVLKATSFEVIATLRDVLKLNSLWRDQLQLYTQNIDTFSHPGLADFGAAISGANKFLLQQVLEELDVCKRLKLTLEILKKELEINKLQVSIAKAIEEKLHGEQRRYLLNEQLKYIKKELGVETDDKTALTAKFRDRIEPNKERCPPHVLQVIEEELTKLQLLEASSSEFNVTRNYLDWLTALPWGKYSDENFDVHNAQRILDEDHYGLSDVKERILEFIAVGKLRGISQGKIICLSGPPGVGKTSIGRSIARALNRKFYRFSVGGLSDVAEIKGHRRTYIGAMPGKIVQCLKNVGTSNPLVLIDEIDKLGRGHAGDPASALLELLDPEQNANFLDHYLDVPIDLSKVMANSSSNGSSDGDRDVGAGRGKNQAEAGKKGPNPDFAWGHCQPMGGHRHQVVCNYCDKKIGGGGITRFKAHIVGGDKNVAKCKKCPQGVRDDFIEMMKAKKETRQQQKQLDQLYVDTLFGYKGGHGSSAEEDSDVEYPPDYDTPQARHMFRRALRDSKRSAWEKQQHDQYRRGIGPSAYEVGGGSRGSGRAVVDLTEDDMPSGQVKRKKGGIPSLFRSASTARGRLGLDAEEPGIRKSQPAQQRLKDMFSGAKNKVGKAVGKFFFAHGIPAHAASEPYLQHLLRTAGAAGPGVKAPTAYELMNVYLPQQKEEIQKWIDEKKERWSEYGVTLMCDGWTSGNRKQIINFLAYCNGSTIFLGSVDASDQVRDSKYIKKQMKIFLKNVGVENVVQIVTDNGPNFKKAGKELMKQYPIYWTPCAAHCIDLMLKDIGGLSHVKAVVTEARTITGFIYNHSFLLAAMRRKEYCGGDLIRPGVTRFATHFLALQSLKGKRDGLKKLFAGVEWSSMKESRTTLGAKIEELVNNRSFWDKITNLLKIMEPIVKVLRLVDGDKSPTIPWLYEAIEKLKETIKVVAPRSHAQYLYIIKKRWDNMLMHPLHKAAHYLNPRFQYKYKLGSNSVFISAIKDVTNRLVTTSEERLTIMNQVLFVCTANVIETIPNPLLDRMEVIALAGYITDEKMHIARDYLEKTTREGSGIRPEQVEVTDAALLELIENYCREAGVRNLQKHIEKIYRKIALKLVRESVPDEHSRRCEAVNVDSENEVPSEPSGIQTEETISEASILSTSESSGNGEIDASHEPDRSQLEKSDQTDSCKDMDGDKISKKGSQKIIVDALNLSDYVGKPAFHAERIYDQTPIGVVMGLAWTSMGGSTLYVETTEVEQGDGKGALNLTGQLGDVMKESAQIAYTVARTILAEKDAESNFFANSKLHLHVPAGATPKDGPSAGCTMITSMLSLAMKRAVKKDLAMTGEVTLTGRILPIGGVKEKTIASRRSGVKTIIFPSANKRDFDELAENVKEGLDVKFVDDYRQIFDLAFEHEAHE